MTMNPFRVQLGILALALLSILSLLKAVTELWPSAGSLRGPDQVSRFEQNLSPLKAALSGEEAVGYLGDYSDRREGKKRYRFQLTQYSLAPIMVTNRRPSPFVVSVGPLDPGLQRRIEEQGLALVRDFGNEVRLFKRKEL